MASKIKKFSGTRASAISVSEQSVKADGSASSLSPTASSANARSTRLHEKEHLSGLNDRLATYIDRVRNLETENARLHVEVRNIEVVERRSKEDLIQRYDGKIAELRKQIESIGRENAKMEMEQTKATSGYENLKGQLQKLKEDLDIAEAHIVDYARQISEATSKFNIANSARSAVEKENKALKQEIGECKPKLSSLSNQLQDEIVLRIELANKLKACQEDLEFARRNHDNQMEEFRRKRQTEMISFSTEVENRYQAKLQDQLQAMRGDFDARIAQSRAEMNEIYENKLAEAAEVAGTNRSAAAKAREEASSYRLKIEQLESSLAGYNSNVDKLNSKIAELENRLRNAYESSDIQLKHRDQHIQQLEDEAAAMLNEYQDLMDVKIQLDTELLAYQKLLEGEESRLHIKPIISGNISQQVSPNNSHVDSMPGVIQETVRRGAKRRRLNHSYVIDFSQAVDDYNVTGHSTGAITIDEVDTVNGSFIRLLNIGDTEQSIGGWLVKSCAGDKEVMFKFRSRQTIGPNATLTIWSNNAEARQDNSVEHAAMKNQAWPIAEEIRTELLDDAQELVAWKEYALEKNSDEA